MKYLPSIIVGFSILLFTPTAYASRCARSDRSFVQSAKQSQLVIRGKVIQYHWSKDDPERKGRPRAMIVEVKEVYKGVTKLAKVTVWGDNGMQTRPYVTQFPIGTEWILALSKDYWTQKGELAISVCGEYWLQVKGNNVVGKVTDGRIKAKPQVISLPNLRKLLKAAP
jgi:hypothetical protein